MPTRPRVYRAMKRADDGKPVVEPKATGLGVRSGADVFPDEAGIVTVGGMSVAPRWQDLPSHRIPRRLRNVVPKAKGSDQTACFATGDGPFAGAAFAPGLELVPDSATHGVIAPDGPTPLTDYEAALAATRSDWEVDES